METKGLTANALLYILSERIRKYRINMSMTQKQLSERSGVSLRCLQRLENNEDVQVTSLFKVLKALELSDNIPDLVPDVSHRPSDYLVRETPRKRVRNSSQSKSSSSGFVWGEDKKGNSK